MYTYIDYYYGVQGNKAKPINAKAMITNDLTLETVLKQSYSNVSKPTPVSIDSNKVKHSRLSSCFRLNGYEVAIGVFTYDKFTTQQEQDDAKFTRFCSYGGFTYTF